MSKILLGLQLLILLFLFSVSFAQQQSEIEGFKKNALQHMQAGRYGEAIDQLNKYISARPREAEGYNLRAQCYEKRSQYENAVLDYRRAIALSTEAGRKSEYENNLRRVQEVWYSLLQKKIEGYLREIAINPNNPFNYLEIGKAYRNMEVWDKAEEWYDKYLEKDNNASPDEIIRYTEILAKTGHIQKGEKILKQYVEKYPDDWRLWSRYGYFTLWLAKYQIAKKAFETALSFKPFFQEAQDGLDIVNREAYVTLQNPRSFEKVYPIDRYYSILKKKPDDIKIRYKLIDELIKANRLQEAYQQINLIGITNSNDPKYQETYEKVTKLRNQYIQDKINEYKKILQENPDDKKALNQIAIYYDELQQYEDALNYLNKYFEKYPDEKDPELRYRYARVLAWNRDFDESLKVIDKLLQDYPTNADYQLLRAQVSVWTGQDIDLANKLLSEIIKKQPNNLDALIAMGSLKLIQRDFNAAQDYANKAKAIAPNNNDVAKLQSNIDWQKLRAEEEKLYSILEEGRRKVLDHNCEAALPYYEEYLSKAEPNVLIQKEYGDVLFCAKQYKKALDVYNNVLSQGYNFDAAMQRAKLYYAMGDSLNAVREFKNLVKEDSSNFDANLYLADSYAKAGEYDSARTIYNNMLDTWKLDSTQVKMITLRKGWLPVTGLAAIFDTFPNYVGFAPISQTYADNESLRLNNFGGRLELGLTNFISLGVSFIKTYIKANPDVLDQNVISSIVYTGNRRFNTFKGHIFFKFSSYITAGVGVGTANSEGFILRDDKDAFFRFEKKDTASLTFNYQNSDGALILYSPYLTDVRYYATLYRVAGYFIHREGLKLEGSFQYISVTDNNEGNDFYLRIGRYFYKNLIIGYEYYYTNYKFKSSFYYSPRNFESHSIFVDNELEKRKELRVTIGGKLGFIPQNNFVALEGHVEAFYQPIRNLTFSGRIGIGSTSRYDSSYRYFSGQFSAYWTIF
ncbi:tetratricopeptide repeat protein [Melioribacteraceae bacterium 4301-Me]|uniref:tetratricopeptide repeat protein n=1 Tax=Pyranulibacter aquaticus TaxID=3163344 RepID=UPI0035988596